MPESLIERLFILFFVALIAAIFLIDWLAKSYLAAKRKEGVSRAGSAMGFSFEPNGEFLAKEEVLHLQLFQRGDAGEILNVLKGTVGNAQVFLFDRHYQTTTTAASVETGGYTLYRLSVAVFRSGGASFPAFELRPEKVLHKIRALFGYQDIDFPESPDFSRRYLLRGAQEAQVRSLFNPLVLRFFSERPGWSVEAQGEWLVVYRDVTGLLWWSNTRVRPKRLPQFLRETSEIFQRLC